MKDLITEDMMERVHIKVKTKIEMNSRLGIIIRAAQIMQDDIIANNLFHIKKQMEEIEQYTALVRTDVLNILRIAIITKEKK